MKRDIALASGNTLKTLVVLDVTPGNGHLADRTSESIAANAVSCAQFIVAAEGAAALDYAALARACRDAGACGVLFVSAGMHVPYAFDIRLARIALEDPLVDTVSPLCDFSGLPVAEIERLDRLAFLIGRRTYVAVAERLSQCCFVAAAAVERLSDPGLLNVATDSVYVGTLEPGGESDHVAGFEYTRRAILEAFHSGVSFGSVPGLDGRPVQLHVIHSLGGGSEKWLKDFALEDTSRCNLVLRSLVRDKDMGAGLALYSHALDETPLEVWNFASPINATVERHLEYRGVLADIVARYCVDTLLVSSLIGHSLDALDTGLPTLVVTHDYFPYCPAINIHFGGVCRTCDAERMAQCRRENVDFNPFTSFEPAERLAVRNRYLELIARPGTQLVTPSRSVIENLVRLNPRFAEIRSATIPHGYRTPLERKETAPVDSGRLRVLVLGQLSILKGVKVLRAALPALREFADLYLVGSKELGASFAFEPNVQVVGEYDLDELPAHVAAINPHVGLLVSIVEETFNYTLSELRMLGVPVAATRVGSFPERIEHGKTGYLFDPDPDSLVAAMKAIDADRDTLDRIRESQEARPASGAAEMVAQYHRLLPVEGVPYARYALRRPSPGADAALAPARDQTIVSQAMTLSGMWKEVKSLHVRLSVSDESRMRERQNFARREQDLEGELQRVAGESEQRAAESQARITRQEAYIGEKENQVQALSGQLHFRNMQLAEVHASTSWKISKPVRIVGEFLRKLKILGRCLRPALHDPSLIPLYARRSLKALRVGGFQELKRELVGLQAHGGYANAWDEYRARFKQEVRPRIVRAVREMPRRPLISVIVPTYNTPEPMLRQMLDSVREQLYPEWELCIADDGSTQPHVAKVLKEYAQRDKRIRLAPGGENRGVSNASNRALEMARGELTVLLDHDDLLEEQALYRMAESVIEDSPDMVYSDELRVSPDGEDIRDMVYRPAFSPEFLRGHPYIVHLVAFRTQLLREVGGFDERLRISQDYDLILRVAEKAKRVVHVPEILYRWRVHAASAGHQKMNEVMDTSRALLQKHLERSGESGTVADGVGFNLFDARYRLQPGLRVAIIIPTKNHGAVLRQCIDSVRATVKEVAYDIVVVNHESDDPGTIAYLASLRDAQVIEYHGAFNFSAINNWAVSHLKGEYSHYLFCNNDIEAMEPGWLERMLELGQRKSVGIVGAKLFYTDRRTIQHAGVCVGAFEAAEHYGKFLKEPSDRVDPGYMGALVLNHEVSAVTAACMLVRKDAFAAVSGFDEALAVGFGDVDLCLRVAERGYRTVFCPKAALIHHESYTRGTGNPHPEDTALFRFRWKDFIEAGDPHYNPALSLKRTDWAVAQPLANAFHVRRRIFTRTDDGLEAMSFSRPAAAGAGEGVDFVCNVCGHRNHGVPMEHVTNREHPSCAGCQSSLRMRSVIRALSTELYGKSQVLPEFPPDKTMRGLGMSDWDGYAKRLAKRVDYTNTYYHAEPRLDITNVPESMAGRYRFLLSSDVFEHIPLAGLDSAFRNCRRLLEPGGVMVFTVPFTKTGETQEHFPRLHDFRIVEHGGRHILHNTTAEGEKEVFDNLIFHGGDGMTLEMRVFSEPDLVRRLLAAGFSEVKVCPENAPDLGIIWPMDWAVPIVARA